jgi:PAS domain S-box-containing protein
MAANLFEAAERVGVRREELTAPLGLDANVLVDPRHGIDWDTLVHVLDRLSDLLRGDRERLREVGRQMVGVPSYGHLQGIGRAMLSLEKLYVAGERWVAPASIPHLVLQTAFPAEGRMHFRCSIPEPYAPSVPYLTVFEGLICGVPTLIGLPQAKILTSELTPRQLVMDVELPPSRSIVERAKRLARVVLHKDEALSALEGQRREMVESLEAAKQSTAEIVTLFDRLPDIVVLHRGGKVVWANRSSVRSLGYTDSSELVGQDLAKLFHPSSAELVHERIHGAADEENVPDLVDAVLVTRAGSRVVVEVSPAKVVSFGGREARLFVARDVTERKRLQQQLLVADRLAAVGMLAAGVAHEVNNPLSYVLNNIEIAQRELAPFGDAAEPSREALGVALDGVDRIRTIIRELLALARVDDDAVGALDPVRLVESTLALARPQIAERATLVCNFAPTPAVRGTPSRIGQVLLNLVTNALEAMSPAKRSTNVLRVAVSPSAMGGAIIEVTDTGAGIAPEHVPHVFEPFFTTKAVGKGTGLGLAISQQLVAEIGGELSFDSAESVGTAFRLTLRGAEDGLRRSE